LVGLAGAAWPDLGEGCGGLLGFGGAALALDAGLAVAGFFPRALSFALAEGGGAAEPGFAFDLAGDFALADLAAGDGSSFAVRAAGAFGFAALPLGAALGAGLPDPADLAASRRGLVISEDEGRFAIGCLITCAALRKDEQDYDQRKQKNSVLINCGR